MSKSDYIDKKRKEANDEIENLLHDVDMKSNFPIFDDYIKQNYLDNILRGGYPLVIDGEDKSFVYQLPIKFVLILLQNVSNFGERYPTWY